MIKLLILLSCTTFGGVFYKQTSHFEDQKIACIKAEGRGEYLYTKLGIPYGFECMRMHKVLKFKKGEYK